MEGTSTNQSNYNFTAQKPMQKQSIDLFRLFNGEKIEVAIDYLYEGSLHVKEGTCIPVTLSYNDYTYVFTQENLNLWGEAKTLLEAEEEIAKAIVKLYKKLSTLEGENKLGPYPKEQLGYLRKYIA